MKNVQSFTLRYWDDRCPQQGLRGRSVGSTPTTRACLLQQYHLFTGVNHAGADVYAQSPASTNLTPAAVAALSKGLHFQNATVMSPMRDEVLFVHVRIFDYAKPETWLKAI